MATKRKPTRRSGESGSTLYGALAGLLLGLIVAAVVAFYVTKAPVPFVDRATRQGDAGKLPDPRQAPDPNAGLYGRDGAAGSSPTGPTATAPAPLPGAGTEPSRKPDDLGALIATLPTSNNTPAAAPAATPAPAAKAPVASAAPTASANGSYYLQAGAFRGQDDAESLKARIILLGLPVAVQKAEVNGKPINRVRVGPFARLDDMNRARGRLGENKIETAVVRQ
ncbi:SPOR domain-containing protein [Achromobacter insuavis]|uniref:SPOR domain-containing protein n=1 Tax=Achromobacter insuavis TaxID=1287735 RepID=UPI000E30A178|nr:SPOR domain-containing protein [Achromobacter insuavis]